MENSSRTTSELWEKNLKAEIIVRLSSFLSPELLVEKQSLLRASEVAARCAGHRSPTDEWVPNTWHIQAAEYYSATKGMRLEHVRQHSGTLKAHPQVLYDPPYARCPRKHEFLENVGYRLPPRAMGRFGLGARAVA